MIDEGTDTVDKIDIRASLADVMTFTRIGDGLSYWWEPSGLCRCMAVGHSVLVMEDGHVGDVIDSDPGWVVKADGATVSVFFGRMTETAYVRADVEQIGSTT